MANDIVQQLLFNVDPIPCRPPQLLQPAQAFSKVYYPGLKSEIQADWDTSQKARGITKVSSPSIRFRNEWLARQLESSTPEVKAEVEEYRRAVHEKAVADYAAACEASGLLTVEERALDDETKESLVVLCTRQR